jgi:hypothetical protein
MAISRAMGSTTRWASAAGARDAALGRAAEGSQEHLSIGAADEEDESSLGWGNGASLLRLAAGYEWGMIRESDGDCDDEPDYDAEPDHDNEPSLCGVTGPERNHGPARPRG